MPHNHNHGCGHESHDHDHGLPSDILGYQDNLFSRIDRPHVVALNSSGEGPLVIKAWNDRNDEETVRIVFSPLEHALFSTRIFNHSIWNLMQMNKCMCAQCLLPPRFSSRVIFNYQVKDHTCSLHGICQASCPAPESWPTGSNACEGRVGMFGIANHIVRG